MFATMNSDIWNLRLQFKEVGVNVIMDKVKKIIEDFQSSMIDHEALSKYYIDFKEILNSSRKNLSDDCDIALKISELFDTFYSKDTDDEKQAYLCEIKSKVIKDDIILETILDVSINDNCEENTIVYSLKGKYQNEKYDPTIVRRKSKLIDNQENIFIRSILTNIVIIFEMYLANVYELLVLTSPKEYFENKKINISDLFDNKVSTIIENTLSQEIERNMFDSLKTLDKIKEKSKIDLDRYIRIRKEFEEIYYRRNLYVHNNGFINTIYLESVDNKYTNSLKVEQRLICDDLYLQNAIEITKIVICTLHYELLNFICADDDDYQVISDVGFEALKNGDYCAAEHIYGILRRHKPFQYIYKAMYEVNYINALKQQGKTKQVETLINKFDVSIATDDFRIAKECLLGNNEGVYSLLTMTYPTSFCAIAVRDWPIFIDFRNSEYYEKFVDEHRSDFDMFVFEEEKDNEICVVEK